MYMPCVICRIYLDMINVFKAYSELMAAAVATNRTSSHLCSAATAITSRSRMVVVWIGGGVTEPNILDTHMVRTMRAVKRSVINLVNTFAERVVDVTVLVRFPPFGKDQDL